MSKGLALTALALATATALMAGPGAAQIFERPPGDAPPPGMIPRDPNGALAAWQEVIPGPDCLCADGSPFKFWVREVDPTKVVFYLEGGGICLDATTCALTGPGENDFYNWNLAAEIPGLGDGMFDFDDPDNPFADYTIVYVSLCTGDGYLGDVARQYAPDLTIEHRGFVDGTAALDYLAATYPAARQVVVVGKTAGSIAAPLYGGLAADLLPEAEIVVLGAQTGGFPDIPEFNALIGDLWGAFATMPAWDVNAGLAPADWGPRQFWIQAGLHDPAIVLARFDYAFDRNAARAVNSLFGIDPANLLTLIDTNEAAIEAAGVVLLSYTAPGDDHGIFEFDQFYEMEVGGVQFTDWLAALLAGEPVADVHCNPCGPGSNTR